MNPLHERIEALRRQIDDAATRVGRNPKDVQLIAVSKRHPAAAIRAAYACGLRDFGENYVQELVGKARELEDLKDLRWHLVGHLQTNKAKTVAQVADCVQTLDNERIIDELSRRAAAEGRNVEVYIEVNIGDEQQKSGCKPEAAEALVQRVRSAPHLTFVGLMTVGHRVDSAEAARPTFVELRELRDRVAPGAALSMGMSGDYAVAIEEGATCVRVGTAIFGERS
jgi:PLP dependent protein